MKTCDGIIKTFFMAQTTFNFGKCTIGIVKEFVFCSCWVIL